MPRDLRELSYPTRGWTQNLAVKHRVLTTGLPGNFLVYPYEVSFSVTTTIKYENKVNLESDFGMLIQSEKGFWK